jgi:hypothetical protein
MSFKFPIYLLLGTMTILLLGCQTEVVPEIVEKEVEVEVTRIEVLEVPMIATQIKEVTRIVTVESPVLLEVEVTPDHTPVPTVPAVDPTLLPGSPERPAADRRRPTSCPMPTTSSGSEVRRRS